MGHNVAWWLGEILWGFVVAAMITFVIYLVVDYRRQSRKTCCWGCKPGKVWPGCALHSDN